MERRSEHGFTLVELLIVLAIIAVLAAVLIPVLLFPRARAHDVGTQSCLKQIGTRQEAIAADSPFTYDPDLTWSDIEACDGVTVVEVFVNDDDYRYTGIHVRGETTFQVMKATPVTPVP